MVCINNPRERSLVCIELPRSDTNNQRETLVCIKKNRKERRKLHPAEAQTEIQNLEMMLKHKGAPLVAESGLGRQVACTG